MTDDFHLKKITELNKLLINKQISSVELLQYFLKRIEKYDSKINSFISIDQDHALTSAKNADKRIKTCVFVRNENRIVTQLYTILHNFTEFARSASYNFLHNFTQFTTSS